MRLHKRVSSVAYAFIIEEAAARTLCGMNQYVRGTPHIPLNASFRQ
jgi:hypothetical protein